MTGTFFGRSYRVVGRVVLGEEEAGQTYYWNEFNLETDAGESATLVYEQTERGGEWRWFTEFEPEYPMTAADAASKRVGDLLNLEGTDVRVTLVGQSRIYHIEGEAPEGEEVGDVAHYFNALSGNNMVVVSWTGQEVEFYRGLDLSRETVSSAFNVRLVDFRSLVPAQGAGGGRSGLVLGLIGALVVVGTIVGFSLLRSSRRPVAVVKTRAPAAPLAVGSSGKLKGTSFQVASHLLVEIGMVGRRFDRHEYLLSDNEGNKALLVYGSRPGAKDWWLFTPLQPAVPLTPPQAAAVRFGQTVNVDGVVAKVDELLQSAIRQVDSAESGDLKAGDVFFGFGSAAGNGRLLARWNATYINFFRGTALTDKEVMAAFGQPKMK